MRYIRTKPYSNVIAGKMVVKAEYNKALRKYMVDEVLPVYPEDIIKIADTIEELCDEFVCLENKMTFHNLETITSSCNLKHLTVYGAIWTDKGLIYVAKMNEKGELELL